MKTRWSEEAVSSWYEKQPWLVGCNFIPSSAINQLEMWQEETFDLAVIEKEVKWAAELGMNTLRVYLHDIAWTVDREGFKKRIDEFLTITRSHGIKPLFVIFDDCWYPDAKSGPQPAPVPGKHNSGWLQSPGKKAAKDRKELKRLEDYVRDIVTTFKDDDRILMWDIYNELGNVFLDTLAQPAYIRIPKLAYLALRFFLFQPATLPLFKKTLQWVRESDPSQPVTAGIYMPHRRMNKVLTASSDVISFHNYSDIKNLEKQINELKKHNRPLVCTEYLSRVDGSLFETFLPVFKREKIGCFNWGLVSGKTQTIYSWADRGRTEEPEVWFHDILRTDGTPFDDGEVKLLKSLTDR